MNRLTDEERALLRGIRNHGKSLPRELFCRAASAILYSSVHAPEFESAPGEKETYLGEHAIKRTLLSLEERGYVEPDEKDPGRIRPSSLVPIEIYQDSNS